jgi:hypothetical protein
MNLEACLIILFVLDNKLFQGKNCEYLFDFSMF